LERWKEICWFVYFILFLGYYLNDRKEGFGIYFWSNPSVRTFIGFWKNGKQDGVGKYINSQETRYGLWSQGERVKWFKNEKEAFTQMNTFQLSYENMFKFNLQDIGEFLNK